jgi:uncharacterized membrane protein
MPPAAPTAPALLRPGGSAAGRLALIDVARGAAIVQMIAYHFCYDLNHFDWIRVDMNRDPGWIAWRTAIVSQFLFLVGVSAALRARSGAAAVHWRRWHQIVACAALVSAASAALFGARWIWFGVLHFVALAQLVLPRMARWGAANLVLGAAILALGLALQLPFFASDALSWIGFSPVKPATEDFVPVFPWLGVVLIGVGTASAWPHFLRAPARPRFEGAVWRVPALLGRWPLTAYMVHQPLLFGALELLALLRGSAPA